MKKRILDWLWNQDWLWDGWLLLRSYIGKDGPFVTADELLKEMNEKDIGKG